MNLLALDTSTHQAAVAVSTGDGAIHVAVSDPAQRHGRNLLPTISALLHTAGLTVRDVDGFAVGLGPGSYTGLRIGLTAAKTLAYTTGKPLVGIGSLELIARNAPSDCLRVSVIADAQRGEIYVADFGRPGPGEALVTTAPPRIEPFARWSERLREPTLVLGPGLDRHRGALPAAASTAAAADNWPAGRQLIALAHDAWTTGRRDDPWLLEPLYLRRSAAEDQWDALTRPPLPGVRG